MRKLPQFPARLFMLGQSCRYNGHDGLARISDRDRPPMAVRMQIRFSHKKWVPIL